MSSGRIWFIVLRYKRVIYKWNLCRLKHSENCTRKWSTTNTKMSWPKKEPFLRKESLMLVCSIFHTFKNFNIQNNVLKNNKKPNNCVSFWQVVETWHFHYNRGRDMSTCQQWLECWCSINFGTGIHSPISYLSLSLHLLSLGSMLTLRLCFKIFSSKVKYLIIVV